MRKADFRRVEGVTKFVEKMPRAAPPRRRPSRTPGVSGRWFWTTSAIGAVAYSGTSVATGKATPGSGTARMYQPDGSGNKVPITASGAADVTIYNAGSVALPANRPAFCTLDEEGKWVIDDGPCT